MTILWSLPLLPALLLCKAPRAINREKVFHVCMFLLVLGVCCFLMRLPPCSRGVCGLLIVIRLLGRLPVQAFTIVFTYLFMCACNPVCVGRKRNKVIHNSHMHYFSRLRWAAAKTLCDSLKILSLRPVDLREIGG